MPRLAIRGLGSFAMKRSTNEKLFAANLAAKGLFAANFGRNFAAC